MPCLVEIYEDVLDRVDSWGLDAVLKERMLRRLNDNLGTIILSELGSPYSVAPVRLWRHSFAIPDPSGEVLHSFVFLFNQSGSRRIVMAGNYRADGAEFPGG
jgi:hypothetical protein